MYFNNEAIAKLYISGDNYSPEDYLVRLENRLAHFFVDKLSVRYAVDKNKARDFYSQKLDDVVKDDEVAIFGKEVTSTQRLEPDTEQERQISAELDVFIKNFLQRKNPPITGCYDSAKKIVNQDLLNYNIGEFTKMLAKVSGEEEMSIQKEVQEVVSNFIETEIVLIERESEISKHLTDIFMRGNRGPVN